MKLEHIHGGHLRKAALRYGINEKDLLDFSANINPLGPSLQVAAAISQNLDAIVSYPDPECLSLRQALSSYIGVATENIIMGNGAAELIYLLLNVARPQKALIPAPTFSEYALALKVAGGKPVYLPLMAEDRFHPSIEHLLLAMKTVDMVFICNPNNPTGVLLKREEILALVEEGARYGVTVVVDEAFMDFVDNPEEFTVIDGVGKYENLVLLYSLTKFFAIPGLRLGAVLGPERLINTMTLSKDPWNVNCFAQLAGVVSLEDREYIERSRSHMMAEKEYLYNELQKLPGLAPYPPAANFIFCAIKGSAMTSSLLTDAMGERGILIRDCSSFAALDDGYIRVAVRTREENERLVAALGEVLG